MKKLIEVIGGIFIRLWTIIVIPNILLSIHQYTTPHIHAEIYGVSFTQLYHVMEKVSWQIRSDFVIQNTQEKQHVIEN